MSVAQQVAIVLQTDEAPANAPVGGIVGERISKRIDQRENVKDNQEEDRRNDEQVADCEVAPAPRGSSRAWLETRHCIRRQAVRPLRFEAGGSRTLPSLERRNLLVAAVFREGRRPVLRRSVKGFLCSALAAHHERIDVLVELV